jgi:predicted small secreted protein
MKKFALLALVLAFGGLMLAGCPTANNGGKPANTGNAPASNAANK